MEALYQDILISVTSFFRNPEVFEALKDKVFPQLLQDAFPQRAAAAWVLGCSTGEEAYSLAIGFTEFAEAAGSQVPMQVFATDLNEEGVEKARAGVYSKNIAQDVSPERLRRFFAEVDGSYRISKPIRDMCVFARHNVLADPPFSRIDLISCRNLLIYLEPSAQQRIVAGPALCAEARRIPRAGKFGDDRLHIATCSKRRTPSTRFMRRSLAQPLAGRRAGRLAPDLAKDELLPRRTCARRSANRRV